jgi:hypothetical protein
MHTIAARRVLVAAQGTPVTPPVVTSAVPTDLRRKHNPVTARKGPTLEFTLSSAGSVAVEFERVGHRHYRRARCRKSAKQPRAASSLALLLRARGSVRLASLYAPASEHERERASQAARYRNRPRLSGKGAVVWVSMLRQ